MVSHLPTMLWALNSEGRGVSNTEVPYNREKSKWKAFDSPKQTKEIDEKSGTRFLLVSDSRWPLISLEFSVSPGGKKGGKKNCWMRMAKKNITGIASYMSKYTY